MQYQRNTSGSSGERKERSSRPVFGMDPLEAEIRIGVVLLWDVAGDLGRREGLMYSKPGVGWKR